MSAYRLPGPAGAWIDRSQKLNFNFDGRALQGYSGDSLASALLASGSMHVARSFKLHRPRGVFCCGIEEPNSVLEICDDGDAIIELPDDLMADIGWQIGDELSIDQEDGLIVIRNLTVPPLNSLEIKV
jgi:hypothetical protein